MKKLIITLVIALLSQVNISQENIPAKHEKLAFGESVAFYSKALNDNRKINIFLPPKYDDDPLKKFPVIYLLDGSIDADFLPTVGLVQLLSSGKIRKLPESIIVGIESPQRTSDFTPPTKVERELNGFPSSGNSENFIAFISDELIRLIETKYTTSDKRTIIGNSFGGLLAAEILMKLPKLFDKYILISPSLWWNNNTLLERDIPDGISSVKIYMAIWENDGINKSSSEKFAEKLKRNAYLRSNFTYEKLKINDHGNVDHFALYNGLKKLNQPSRCK